MLKLFYKDGAVYDAETEAKIKSLVERVNENPELLKTFSPEDVFLFCTGLLRKTDEMTARLDKTLDAFHHMCKDKYLMGLENGGYTNADTEVLEAITLNDLPLSAGSVEQLTHVGTNTLADLCEWSLLKLVLHPDIKCSCLEEVVLLLDRYHLSFKALE